MEARELIGTEHMVEFVASRDSKPMARIQSFIAFPCQNWLEDKPTIGKSMMVEVVGTNAKGTVLFINQQDSYASADWGQETPDCGIVDADGNDITFG